MNYFFFPKLSSFRIEIFLIFVNSQYEKFDILKSEKENALKINNFAGMIESHLVSFKLKIP